MPENDFAENENHDLLARATAVADEYTDGDEYAYLMEIISTQHAERGDFETAIQRAESIPDPYLKDRAMGAIAVKASEQGESQLALELVDTVQDQMLHETYIEQIAVKTASEGNFKEAIQLADGLGDPSPVLSNIVSVYVTKGDVSEALELARSIDTVGVRVNTLNHIAAKLAQDGNTDDALQLVQEGADEIDDIEFPEDQIHALVGMAIILDKLGEKGNGFDKLAEAYKICRTLDDSEPGSTLEKDETMIEVIGGFGELKFFEKADQILGEIEGPFQFAQASIRLAHSYFRDGKDAEAEELLTQAVEICKEQMAYSEQGVRQQNQLFAEIAAAYALNKRFGQAIEIIKLVMIDDDKRSIIETVGILAARANDVAVVERVGGLLENPTAGSSYWVQIADAFAELNESEEVSKSLAKALKSSEAIELVYDRVLATGEIAERSSDQPAALFTKAIKMIPQIESRYRQARALLSAAAKFSSASRNFDDTEPEALPSNVFHVE
jgi:tetratricopeptide (TPR) repeat protein